jgi:23S rRNA (uracil1939-C5)-methyltransferase
LRTGTRFIFKIDRFSVGGRGVGRHEGLVVFVPDVAPLETVEVELTKVKKNFAEARLIKVIEPSEHRIKPSCPHAGVCGGCAWMHLTYSEQLISKRSLVAEALLKFSGYNYNSEVDATVPSPNQFRYRNRIQVHVQDGQVGFHRRGSNQIVNIKDCLIADQHLTPLLSEVRREANKSKRRLELYLSHDGQPEVRQDNSEDDQFVLPFSQVNSAQNEILINYVVEQVVQAAAEMKTELAIEDTDSVPFKLFDLYAGNGNFTFPLARALPHFQIASAELNSQNVRSARAVAQLDFPDRKFQIEEADVELFLDRALNQPTQHARQSIVILDPPRVGCSAGVMNSLAQKAPRYIVYISCHPVTLARDLKYLNTAGYSLLSVRPFDMFPQTDHVETVAVLRSPEI